MIAPATGGAATTPVPSLDLGPDRSAVGEDGALYFDTGVKGEFQLFKIDPAAHRLTQVTIGPARRAIAELCRRTARRWCIW